MTLQTEEDLQKAIDKGNENRVTLASIEAKVKSEEYVVMGLTTICQLTLENGFTVSGESACVDASNFNAEIGKTISRKRAIEKMWPLEGYLLAERLYRNR